MKTEYVRKSLDSVLGYFQSGFKPRKGEEIIRLEEPIVDISKRVVIFPIITIRRPAKRKK